MAVSLAPTRIKLLTAVAAAAAVGTSAPVLVEGRDVLAFFFTSTGVTTGGTLIIEEADYDPEGPTYAGTWSQIGDTINANDFTGGAQQSVHIVGSNTFTAVRVRVDTNITGGGTVSVVLKMA